MTTRPDMAARSCMSGARLPRVSHMASWLWAALILVFSASLATAQTTLKISWYDEAHESVVLRELLDRFERENADITVGLEVHPYGALLENLPNQIASGDLPDIARITDLDRISDHLLDLTPHLTDPPSWNENFGPFLKWLRPQDNPVAISGFMTGVTVTGVFVNATMFARAGVALPEPGASWDDWANAARLVGQAAKIPYPMAWDRSGHRIAGPALSYGASMLDDAGNLQLDFRLYTLLRRIFHWHRDETMNPDHWGAVSGPTFVEARAEFADGNVAVYLSGSWQIKPLSDLIGDRFDWQAVPAPCGSVACVGMPGGSALVAFAGTENPVEVARLMEFLTRSDVLAEYHQRTLTIPAHSGLVQQGLSYHSADPRVEHALLTFTNMVPDIPLMAFDLQGNAQRRVIYNTIISRLGEAIAGEVTLREAFALMNTDIEQYRVADQ